MLIERCRAIAAGDLDQAIAVRTGDELEQLVDAFNAMSQQLADSRAQTEAARRSLEQARDQLEIRVAERTRELTELNQRLRHEVAERARAEERLAETARTDPLTGLMNRRAMLESLNQSLLRFEQQGTPFTVLLGDLDHFKSVNDNHGHDVGDKALIRTAECIHENIRCADAAARWGGEEFLVLLPGAELTAGMRVAEAIRGALADQDLVNEGKPLALTMSLGVAAYQQGQTLDQCIKAADTALYEAKLDGRNRSKAA
jgi:diguanylate cyclase (GGDEF)-like protein